MGFLKRHLATVLVAMVTAIVTAAAPSIAHVTQNWIHLRDRHVKPFADGRYPKKTALKTPDGAINQTADPVHWTNLSGVPASIADGEDSDGAASLSSELQTSDGTINESGDPVHWTNLQGVPAGLADGTDAEGAGGGSGMPLIRWGTQAAPAGTTLLYSGVAFEAHNSHYGTETRCIQGDDPAPTNTVDPATDILYPVETNGNTASTITQNRLVYCAVFLPPGPTVIIWGSWDGPADWTLAYKGYSMGSHYTMAGRASTNCVDSDSFDASTTQDANGAVWYQTAIHVAPNDDYSAGKSVKCSVWMLAE